MIHCPEELRQQWRAGGSNPAELVSLVKADLQRRFDAGERPDVAGYLSLFPELRGDSDWVISLIYEEFCLREEAGEDPDPDSFCQRYAPWRDSLMSQLNYHRMLSRAAGGALRIPRFPEPGERFMSFRLREILGQGGAARVFLADDEELGGRASALKVSADRGEEPSIMARLEHRHIMRVLSVVRDPESGLRGLCMPFLPGRSLDQILGRMEPIPAARRTRSDLLEAAAGGAGVCLGEPGWEGFPRDGSYAEACSWIAARLAEALDHAHRQEVLHRDVKPANILICRKEGPQLLDFNLAHDPHAPERAESALRGGTLPYMAPEQLEAFRDPERWDRVGASADVYALGLVLRELLGGKRPEAPPADVPLPRAINDLLITRACGWTPIRSENPAVPHALDAILRRCLAFAPADRYPSAAALADDLHAFLRRAPTRHVRNPDRRERCAFWVHRNRRSLAGVAAAGAVLTALAVAWISLREGPEHAVAYIDRGAFAHESWKKSITLPEEDRRRRLEEARSHYRRALELDPDAFRAYHGLALVALDEGDHGLHDQLIDRSIQAYQSWLRSSGRRGDSADETVIEYRKYVSALYLQKVRTPLGSLVPFLDEWHAREGDSSELHGLADRLRSEQRSLEIALEFGEDLPDRVRIRILLNLAFSNRILADCVADAGERARFRARCEAYLDQILKKQESAAPREVLEQEFALARELRQTIDGRNDDPEASE